jgi:5'-3' exonuclease
VYVYVYKRIQLFCLKVESKYVYMGIKNLSKVFNPDSILKIDQIVDEELAVDAMNLIYRASLATASVATLTDPQGNPTVHIKTILAQIVALLQRGNTLTFVFDSREGNQEKTAEVQRRADVRNAATRKLAEQKLTLSDVTTEKLKKQAFSLPPQHIADIKYILDMLCIRYTTAPPGFEAEAVCSWLTGDIGECSAVLSGDMDVIPFAATKFYRQVRGSEIHLYTLDNILKQIAAHKNGEVVLVGAKKKRPVGTLTDLRKICVILGSDFAPKTRGVGAMTVLKKWEEIALTPAQLHATKHFSVEVPAVTFVESRVRRIDDLTEWLVTVKGFNRAIVTAQLKKI